MEEFVIKKSMYEDAKKNYPILLDRLQRTPRNTRTYATLYEEVQKISADRTNYSWLENVNNLEAYQKALFLDSRAWGDAEVLGKLQYTTSTKAVLISKDATSKNGGNPVIYEAEVLTPEKWTPEHYLIIAYDEGPEAHFSLVSYAGRFLFDVEEELPYNLRQAMPS